nr:cysteine-rich receptor-like protein kinase 10 [Ipomoea batatas]
MDDFQKWIIVVFVKLSLHVCAMAADGFDVNYEWHECGRNGTYTAGSAYGENLNTLVSSLPEKVNNYGFYNGSIGQDSDRASAIALCRGDADINLCRSCVSDTARRIIDWCPTQKEAFGWYNICSIYYSDKSIIGGSWQTTPVKEQNSDITHENVVEFNEDLTNLVNSLRGRAANGDQFLKYAADSTPGPETQTIYAYMQCTPDLSVQDCTDCLNNATTVWNNSDGKGKIGARVLRPDKTVIIIVVCIAAGLIGIAICIFIIYRKFQKMKAANSYMEEGLLYVDYSAVDMNFELRTLQNATDNFSEANKIGEGGFGVVYKGELQNGELIAVKRLSKSSGQDDVKRGYLNWERRYTIIENIARGLVYLHQDSRHRIIHRDLKANNILLDADLNPKIADFGMARLFPLNQAQGSTNTLVGAYGYVAPEYARYGKFSEKSDVYSFGVLVLEIISGQRHTTQNNGEVTRDLLFEVWTHWKKGSLSDVIDPKLQGSSNPSHEITRCIHVGLLCVQQSAVDRPKMSRILQMLSRNSSMKLSEPLHPGFFTQGSVNS